MYPKAELLFPPRLISQLRNLRGPEWASLVDRVARVPETDAESLAFTLMMIRLDGCVKCHEGSFRYMRGCQLCATQTVVQFKGLDSDLVMLYQKARRDVDAYLSGAPMPDDVDEEAEGSLEEPTFLP
jgi:hypothetical protein